MKKVEKLANEIRESMQGWQVDLEGHLESINDILNKHAPIEKPFPKHMVSLKGTVVLWEDNKKGIVQKAGLHTTWDLGQVCTGTIFRYFKDCEIQVKP